MNMEADDFPCDSEVRWQYAVTYPTAPHEYTVFEWYRGRPQVLDQLRQFAFRIEREGVVAKFGTKEFRYLVLGDFKYWIMEPANTCMLINRTFLDDAKCLAISTALKTGRVQVQKGSSLADLQRATGKI